jgi:Mor family transcriptional regulator
MSELDTMILTITESELSRLQIPEPSLIAQRIVTRLQRECGASTWYLGAPSREPRNLAIVEARRNGEPIPAIAKRYNLNERTVRRVLKRMV